jgi:hypothetical protein
MPQCRPEIILKYVNLSVQLMIELLELLLLGIILQQMLVLQLALLVKLVLLYKGTGSGFAVGPIVI